MTYTYEPGINPMGAEQEYTLTEEINPPLAEEYLRHHKVNRPLREKHVLRYVGMMMQNQWKLTHQGIAFDSEGNLIDGRHRLTAIVRSGVTVRMKVTRNADLDTIHLVDGGIKRNLADSLEIMGEKQPRILATLINAYHKIQVAENESVAAAKSASPERTAALKLLEANPGLRGSIAIGERVYRALRFPKGVAGALYYDMSSADAQEAEVFFEYLVSGSGLTEGDPIYSLRKKVQRESGSRPRRNHLDYAAWTRKAWNAWLAGDDLQIITWSPGGQRKEGFPKLSRP